MLSVRNIFSNCSHRVKRKEDQGGGGGARRARKQGYKCGNEKKRGEKRAKRRKMYEESRPSYTYKAFSFPAFTISRNVLSLWHGGDGSNEKIPKDENKGLQNYTANEMSSHSRILFSAENENKIILESEIISCSFHCVINHLHIFHSNSQGIRSQHFQLAYFHNNYCYKNVFRRFEIRAFIIGDRMSDTPTPSGQSKKP